MADTIKAAIGDNQFSKLASEEAWIGATRVSTIRAQYWQGRHATLPELLWATQYHRAKEPIIKLNALLGIITPEELESVAFLPSDGLSTIEKFIGVANVILRKSKNLDVFSYASCRRWETGERPGNVPSWVPNFGLEGRSIEPLIRGVFGPKDYKDCYNAGEQDTATFSFSADDSGITVSGIRVDHILAVEDTFIGQETKEQLLQLYQRAEQTGFSTKSTPPKSTFEVFWRTLRLDQKDGRRLQNGDEQLVGLDLENDKDSTQLFQKDGLFDLQYCKGRRLLISKEGYICLGPVQAKAGDIITVMPGGKVPYLLRESGENFELVGEWYVTCALGSKRWS
jgi:hypothetical protein